jgi:hypothetical protein
MRFASARARGSWAVGLLRTGGSVVGLVACVAVAAGWPGAVWVPRRASRKRFAACSGLGAGSRVGGLGGAGESWFGSSGWNGSSSSSAARAMKRLLLSP